MRLWLRVNFLVYWKTYPETLAINKMKFIKNNNKYYLTDDTKQLLSSRRRSNFRLKIRSVNFN